MRTKSEYNSAFMNRTIALRSESGKVCHREVRVWADPLREGKTTLGSLVDFKIFFLNAAQCRYTGPTPGAPLDNWRGQSGGPGKVCPVFAPTTKPYRVTECHAAAG
jgi:hypothetical protein